MAIWGRHAQFLTDAVRYESPNGTVRFVRGTEVKEVSSNGLEPTEFWLVSTPRQHPVDADPTKLTHSVALFDFLVDATPVIGECPEATGSHTRETALPCSAPQMASLGSIVAAPFPWFPEFCNPGYFE